MDNSFAVDESEHERVYTKTIEPASFLGTTSVDKPRIVIIGGQTGAGKTKIVEHSMREFADGNVVTVNTDDLRALRSWAPRVKGAGDLYAGRQQ